MPEPLRIEAFRIPSQGFELVPSAPLRAWMDAFPDRHPYRCLPLSIANAHGWDVLCPATIDVKWNGGDSVSDLTVSSTTPLDPGITLDHVVRSNFSRGIVTFHVGYLFRTPPGWNLMVSGPFNRPKDGAYPLTGIIEADWLPYTFTMNWQMTRPGTVRFEKGEPLCTLLPIPKDYLGEWEVAIHELGDDPKLKSDLDAFTTNRDQFLKKLSQKDEEAVKQGWQRHYFLGRLPDGSKAEHHTNKLRLAQPVNRSGTPPLYAREPSCMQDAPLPATQAATPHPTVPPLAVSLLHEAQSASIPDVAPLAKPASLVRPWAFSPILSPLLDTDPQTEANFAGRARLQEGKLRNSRDTREITSGEGLDFICDPTFLPPESCAVLLELARQSDQLRKTDATGDDYWKSRLLYFADILAASPDAAAIMKDAQLRIMERTQAFYQLVAPLWTDTTHLVRWQEGAFMSSHSDNANPDGAPHPLAHRDYSSIVYLNDDFEGGEVYFTAKNLRIRPRPGMLLAFSAGWRDEHAVLKVERGTRYTMAAFYTFDYHKRDPLFYA